MRFRRYGGLVNPLMLGAIVTFLFTLFTLTSAAHALMKLSFSDGVGGSFTATDEGAGDIATGVPGFLIAAAVDGPFIGIFQIGSSSSLPNQVVLTLDAKPIITATGPGTLTIQLTDTDYTFGPPSPATLKSQFTLTSFIAGATSTATPSQCVDKGNVSFGCASLEIDHPALSPGLNQVETASAAFTSSVLFSMTEIVKLKFVGGGGSAILDFSSQATTSNFTATIPQPGALLLLGLGLTGLWALPMWRASRRRGTDD